MLAQIMSRVCSSRVEGLKRPEKKLAGGRRVCCLDGGKSGQTCSLFSTGRTKPLVWCAVAT